MLESALFARVRPKLQSWGALDRIESSTAPGIWDVYLTCNGVGNWVETKMERSGKLHFERFQLNFGKRHYDAGETNLFVLAGHDSRDGRMSVYHISALLKAEREIHKKWHVLRTEHLSPCLVMWKPYDWAGLRGLLSSPFT